MVTSLDGFVFIFSGVKKRAFLLHFHCFASLPPSLQVLMESIRSPKSCPSAFKASVLFLLGWGACPSTPSFPHPVCGIYCLLEDKSPSLFWGALTSYWIPKKGQMGFNFSPFHKTKNDYSTLIPNGFNSPWCLKNPFLKDLLHSRLQTGRFSKSFFPSTALSGHSCIKKVFFYCCWFSPPPHKVDVNYCS